MIAASRHLFPLVFLLGPGCATVQVDGKVDGEKPVLKGGYLWDRYVEDVGNFFQIYLSSEPNFCARHASYLEESEAADDLDGRIDAWRRAFPKDFWLAYLLGARLEDAETLKGEYAGVAGLPDLVDGDFIMDLSHVSGWPEGEPDEYLLSDDVDSWTMGSGTLFITTYHEGALAAGTVQVSMQGGDLELEFEVEGCAERAD